MIALSIVLGFVVGVSAAFFIVAAYRQGLADGQRKADNAPILGVLQQPAPKKKKEPAAETQADEFEKYLKKEREGANNL